MNSETWCQCYLARGPIRRFVMHILSLFTAASFVFGYFILVDSMMPIVLSRWCHEFFHVAIQNWEIVHSIFYLLLLLFLHSVCLPSCNLYRFFFSMFCCRRRITISATSTHWTTIIFTIDEPKTARVRLLHGHFNDFVNEEACKRIKIPTNLNARASIFQRIVRFAFVSLFC